jgi:hypothetical protein
VHREGVARGVTDVDVVTRVGRKADERDLEFWANISGAKPATR